MTLDIEKIKADALAGNTVYQSQEVLELITRLEAAEKDAARLDYLQDKLLESVIRLGDSWYWRTGYGKPHKKAQSLREAIDAVMKEST